MMKVAVSAGGRFHAFNLAGQLVQRNALAKFFTFSCSTQDYLHIPRHLIAQQWPCRLLDLAFSRLHGERVFNRTSFNLYKDSLFDRCVARALSHSKLHYDIFVVWANYGLASIEQARKRKALIIIESGSAHIKEQAELLAGEYANNEITNTPVNPKTIARVTQEYAAADYITVPSSFARNSFIKHGIPAEKLLMVPCGMNLGPFLASSATEPRDKKFRVIFVGLLCLRKGVHYLIEAWNNLDLPEDQCELLLIGTLHADLSHVLKGKKLKRNIIFYGATSQENVRKLYTQSSVFVLPSIEDGFGMVMGEAMAAGLPVICTTNTAAGDLVIDGQTGSIIPPGNTQALASSMAWYYHYPEACIVMGNAGKQCVPAFSNQAYGTRIHTTYTDLLTQRRP